MREWFACTFPGNAIFGSAAALALAPPRDATPTAFNSELAPASTTMTRARHIHAARGRRREDGDGAGRDGEPQVQNQILIMELPLLRVVFIPVIFGRADMQHHDTRDAKKWVTRARNGKTLDWRAPGLFQISKVN